MLSQYAATMCEARHLSPAVVSVSVVSHAQQALVARLLRDLAEQVSVPVEVILTINVPEQLEFDENVFPFPLKVRRNTRPLGFGANHNAAFCDAAGEAFCVVNPDIRLLSDPFPELLACLHDPARGVVAPVVRNPAGALEDSARHFPTPWSLLRRAFHGPRPEYPIGAAAIRVDWVAGMFMLFRRNVFAAVHGFDPGYFLYYEDVDLCARLALSGLETWICPGAQVVHEARRSSHRDLRYLRWHLASMTRFFAKTPWTDLRRVTRG
jgi:GT2 family glycosyltransferase